MNRGLFVTGTDTGVGKTYVSSLILRELRQSGVSVGAYKPACSGAEFREDGSPFWPDLEALQQAAEIDDLRQISPYRLIAPLAPPVAARQAGLKLDLEVMQDGFTAWRNAAPFTVVEGVGGLLCPLTETETIADFADWTGLPLLVVARLGLGTINHTLLTLEVAASRGLRVSGIVLNDVLNERETLAAQTNVSELSSRTSVPILGVLPHSGTSLCLWPDMRPARIAWQSWGALSEEI